MLRKNDIENEISACIRGEISVRECAARIGCAPSTVQRWKKRFESGNFTHGRRGRPPANKGLHGESYYKIVSIYEGFPCRLNFSHFTSFLRDFHGIEYSRNYVGNVLSNEGYVSPKTHRGAKRHVTRPERERAGELVQIDASIHEWFSDGEKYSIHGAIDDATHQIAALYMTRNECRLGYNEMFLRMAERFGIPRELYADMSTSFFSSRKLSVDEQLAGQTENKTQWLENCDTLHIKMTRAHSPQAKGRIERLWETLQDRLVKEFLIFGIDTPEKANAFFPGFIKRFNREFAVTPATSFSEWREVPFPTGDFEDMYSVRHETRTDAAGVFCYHDMDFQLVGKNAARKKITLYLSERNGVFATVDGVYRDVRPLWRIQTVVNDAMPEVERDLLRKFFLETRRPALAPAV